MEAEAEAVSRSKRMRFAIYCYDQAKTEASPKSRSPVVISLASGGNREVIELRQPPQQQLKQSVGHVYYNGIWSNCKWTI